MATYKTGFSYYNVDTDRYQDIRIKRLKKEFRCDGIAVYDYILCEIYRVRGCFLEWDDNTAFDVAEYFGLKESSVSEIVSYCCNVGLFNKELRASGSVLTSESIQHRFIEMCRRAKRSDAKIPEEYNIIREECPITQEESTEIREDFHRVKKSRVKKSKEEESMCEERTSAHESGDSATPTHSLFLEFENFIRQYTPRVAQMQEPFCTKDFEWLCNNFLRKPGDDRFVRKILSEMHNSAELLTKNVNAYITFLKFAKHSK